MIIFKQKEKLQRHLQLLKREGKSVGFVPTMGALHNGHLSLIRQSRTESAITVCSIFVNPTQFNNKEDFEKYPRHIEEDIHLLESQQTDILFLPDEKEIYPEDEKQRSGLNFGSLENVMEGLHRPGHFAGVGTVVSRLLFIVQPDYLYLGQKDYQQYLVISRLVEQNLKMPLKIRVCEIVREPGGLAMSSRNSRLSAKAREDACQIYRVLTQVKADAGRKDLNELKSWAVTQLKKIPAVSEVDYFEIADATSLHPVEKWSDARSLIACTAVRIENIRLIDNLLL